MSIFEAKSQTYITDIDTAKTQVITPKIIDSFFGKKVAIFKDASQKMSFEQIKKQEFTFFKHNKQRNWVYPDTVYWFKWQIFSQLPHDTEKLLFLGNVSELDIYIEYKKDSIIHKTSGSGIPASKRDINMWGDAFHVTLLKNQVITLWIKMKSHDTPGIRLFKLSDIQPKYIAQNKETFKEALLQGIFLLFFLYNIMLLVISKDITYLYYVIYIFVSQSVMALSTIPENFLVGEYLRYHDYIFIFLLGNIAIWYMLFVRQFNQTYKYSPKLDKWIMGYGISRIFWVFLVVFLGGLNVFNLITAQIIIKVTISFDIIWGIIMAMLQSKEEKRNPIYKYITYGSAFLFVGGGLSTFPANWIGLPYQINVFGYSFAYFEMGLFAQLCTFSIGLSMRGKQIEQENQKAQAQLIQELEKNEKLIKEQNSVLEQKVRERTIELAETNEELNVILQTVQHEREKSDKLLLNILPEQTAQELKEKGFATPKTYKLVTVLFTDFKGFTQIAEKLSPEQVIENLNTCFLAFDEICEKYNLEKIKTIGDAYMCAGGLPKENDTNPIDVVNAGIEMQMFMQKWKNEKQQKGETTWELRMGIHSGEVIAGVVGKNKFAYDIWGDTVNLASRMESSGEVGQVNISETTFELVKNHFQCEFRGKIQAKNKGEVNMYFVTGQPQQNE